MDNLNGIISLLIACLELVLLINLIVFTSKNSVNIMAMLLIALLMIYQVLEYLMCGLNLNISFVAYLAFFDISFLPPLALSLVLKHLGYSSRYSRYIYIPAAAFVIYYSFVIREFKVVSCTVLYAAYNYPLGDLYGFFYYLPVVIAMILLYSQIKKDNDSRRRKTSGILLGGFIFISIPVVIAFLLALFHQFALLNVIESIMCKFAFGFALSLGVLTLYNAEKRI